MPGNSKAKSARKLQASGRGHLLEGDGVVVRDPDPVKVRPDGIPADAVAGLKVRFGHQWLRPDSAARVARELAERLPAPELRALIAALEQHPKFSGGLSDAGVADGNGGPTT